MTTEFGKLIKKARIEAGVNQSEMAAAIGTSTSFLSSLERGKKNISKKWIDRIIAYFNQAGIDINEDNALRIYADISNGFISIDALTYVQKLTFCKYIHNNEKLLSESRKIA